MNVTIQSIFNQTHTHTHTHTRARAHARTHACMHARRQARPRMTSKQKGLYWFYRTPLSCPWLPENRSSGTEITGLEHRRCSWLFYMTSTHQSQCCGTPVSIYIPIPQQWNTRDYIHNHPTAVEYIHTHHTAVEHP